MPKRQREFALVRRCARRALVDLGLPPAPIMPGDGGAPQWPRGVVGSMTHCEGYCAAAVALATDFAAVGIDAEPVASLPDGVIDMISSAEERAHLRGLRLAEPGMSWDRLLFSVKESVYKAWFPLVHRWLGFDDVAVELDPVGGRFTATVPCWPSDVAGAAGLTGRWAVQGGLLLTAVTVPR